MTDESQETQGILIPGTSTFEASSNQFDAEYPEVRQDGYTLVELQPAKNDSSYVDQESNDDECLSPVFELNYPTVQSVSEPEQGNDRPETGECRDPTESLNEDDIDVDDVGEKSEVHRCLSLNRKYQVLIVNNSREFMQSGAQLAFLIGETKSKLR